MFFVFFVFFDFSLFFFVVICFFLGIFVFVSKLFCFCFVICFLFWIAFCFPDFVLLKKSWMFYFALFPDFGFFCSVFVIFRNKTLFQHDLITLFFIWDVLYVLFGSELCLFNIVGLWMFLPLLSVCCVEGPVAEPAN